MADAAEDTLEAPRWWMKKGQFLSFFNDYFYNRNTGEGAFVVTQTADGTPTLYHPAYRQHFHTLAGAGSESEKKFAEPSALDDLLKASAQTGHPVSLLDVGFGLGGNTFAAVQYAEKVPGSSLEIVSLENDERTLRAACQLYKADSFQHNILLQLLENHSAEWKNSRIKLLLDDGRKSIRTLPDNAFDLVWLDAFSPDVNPELWSWQFMQECFRIMRQENSMLLTYSSAPGIRGALFKAGFTVGETPSFGRKRGGTIAVRGRADHLSELPEKEKHIIFDSTAGTPYSDPGLNHSAEWMILHRKKLLEKLRKHGVPKWYKAR